MFLAPSLDAIDAKITTSNNQVNARVVVIDVGNANQKQNVWSVSLDYLLSAIAYSELHENHQKFV